MCSVIFYTENLLNSFIARIVIRWSHLLAFHDGSRDCSLGCRVLPTLDGMDFVPLYIH